MVQPGKAPFSSAWGFRNLQTSGRLDLLRREIGSPLRIQTVWLSWWLADVTTVCHKRNLSDVYSGSGDGSAGARNIFIGGAIT